MIQMASVNKTYSEIFPTASSDPAVDADVVVIGAGIAGSSIAHQCSLDRKCRVILLEQCHHPREESRSVGGGDDGGADAEKHIVNRGSSRGGPRRIGTIGGDDRTLRAWKEWMGMNDSTENKDLLDVTGEVYIFALFPVGVLFLLLIGALSVYNKYISRKQEGGGLFPEGFQILHTPKMISEKLGNRQGFCHDCWSGCIGIYHKEAAVLHTDKILRHFLHHKERKDNLDVRHGSCVTKIEMKKKNNDDDDMESTGVTVTVTPDEHTSTEPYQLRCRHLAIAAGGWTGTLLKDFLQTIPKDQSQHEPTFDPTLIQDKLEVFTCPVYTINNDHTISETTTAQPLPFTIASDCPIFSCVHKKVYGFPANHERCLRENQPLELCIRPFDKAFDGDDPDDQRISHDQLGSIHHFVKDCFIDPQTTGDEHSAAVVTYSHAYTCRYPKLSFDGGQSYQPVLDYVPGSNNQIVAAAGLDGYGFKFGSIYGLEFMELLDTGKAPKGLEWPPQHDKNGKGNITQRLIHGAFMKLARYVFTSTEGADKDNEKDKQQ